ncbi:Glycosyl hydrolase catalytic core domain-containing protein 5 [Elsinoe fawcettii]|nr:Glycosyl hydrolase catalytic core domain-containing protein 5 [Elsinoe fawcettii]
MGNGPSRPAGPNKRVLSWSYTNTRDNPSAIDKLNFNGPITAVTNWEAWYPNELNGRLPFQPMLHSKDRISSAEWQNVEQTWADSIIHFFNEPERANTSPEEAANLWRQHMLPLRNKRNRIVTPSCASDPAGTAWIRRFMDLTRDAQPDFIGVHWYGERADDMRAYLQDIHNSYPNIPICVTEWACIARDGNTVVDFTIDMCNWMDNTTWIFQHALFGATTKPADDFVSVYAQLMNGDGSWTDLMYKYMYDQPMHR